MTIVIVIIASLGAAGGLTWFFLKKRSQRRASDEYTKSLINEALLTENLTKQQKAVTDLQTTITDSNTRTDDEQKALMQKLAESQKELEQLKNNVTLAVRATNSLSLAKNAADNKSMVEAARDTTVAELKALEEKNKIANQTTVDALNFTTNELTKQAADLKAFKTSLQTDAVKLAADVGNPSIVPPVLPESSKPSIRTAWDAAVNEVATADDQDLAIKQLSELYKIIGTDVNDLKNAAKQMNAAPTVCERIYREAFGGICPVGWTEWKEQCYRGPCDNSPSPTPNPPTPKPPTPKPPTPKPPTPKPPTALEKKYPYWGWDKHAGLRCRNKDNTGCDTGYDAKGQLVDLNPDRPPAPSPGPSAGSVVLLGNEVRVNLSNKTTSTGGGRGFSQKWPIPSQFKNACKMSFDINFQPGFSFGNNTHSEGGKVGGLHVGSGAASGCRHTDSGSSLRLVWDGGPDKRFKGSGASAYTYIPSSSRGKQPDFVNKEGDPNCGLHLWRNESDNIFSEVGSWYHVVLGIKLNDVGKSNGKIYYSITGPKNLTKESDGFMWRTSNYTISEASVSSFFGGGGNQMNVWPSTYLIKNVMLSPY